MSGGHKLDFPLVRSGLMSDAGLSDCSGAGALSHLARGNGVEKEFSYNARDETTRFYTPEIVNVQAMVMDLLQVLFRQRSYLLHAGRFVVCVWFVSSLLF